MDIQGKEVVLFGILRYCERFFTQFQRILPIAAIIVTDEETYRTAQSRSSLPVRYYKGWQEHDRKRAHIICCCSEEDRRYFDGILEEASLFYGGDYTDGLYWLSFYGRKMGLVWPPEKEIWIYGAGNNGGRFYGEQRDRGVRVAGFLSNYEIEESFQGLPVIRPGELLNRENPYVVICSDAWEMMGRELENLGYQGLRDYCFPEWIPKRLFISVGVCQVYYTAKLLNASAGFKALFHHLVFFQPGGFLSSFADEVRVREYGDVCDTVFYRRKSFESDEMSDASCEVIEKYYAGCRRISIPFYYFFGQHMQATRNTNPYEVQTKPPYYLYFRGDSEINRLAEAGVPTEEIMERVSDPAYWTEKEIRENLQKEIHKVKILDKLSSVKIAGFVEAHYREFPIFRDGTHFGMELSIFIADRILEMLDIMPFCGEEADRAVEEAEPPLKACMPVYPCVVRALDLKFGKADSIYAYVKADASVDQVDFREYVRRYAEYVRSVRGILSEYGAMIW